MARKDPYRELLSGNIFMAFMGTLTTPLATAATSAVAFDIPHAWIRVPSGTAIIPLYAKVTVEAAGATTQGEIIVISTSNDVGDGTSSAAAGGPLNTNTGSSATSLCTARQLASVAVTTPTGVREMERFSFAASAVNGSFIHNRASTRPLDIIRGPGTWMINIGGNAVSYYAQMYWAEYLEADL